MSRGLGDVYKRQGYSSLDRLCEFPFSQIKLDRTCLLYTSDAADDSLRVDLGGRRIIKK
ncbi:hypothetical protein JMUB7526_28670 [Staphylococcus aureus]